MRTTTVPHFKEGLCEDCGGSSIGGELREKIITEHNDECDHCGISRDEAKIKYGRDFLSFKNRQKCSLQEMSFKYYRKKLGDSRKYKWRMFYK